MSSVLITSTMKSDPGMPLTRASSRGVPVSASAALPEGGSAEGALGALGACATRSAERAGAIAVAAPAATTPVRNLRRSAFGPVSLRVIDSSSSGNPGEDSNPLRTTAPTPAKSGASFLRAENPRPTPRVSRAKPLQLHALVGENALHRRALRHAVLERGVVFKLRHGQLAPLAPGVEHQGVGVEHRVFVGQPLAPRVHGVDLLQVFAERLLPHRLDAGEGRLVLGVALGPADVGVRGMHAGREKADDGKRPSFLE